MSVTFVDRSVIVTGAGNGLGRQHALLLARLGAAVTVNDLGGSTDGSGRSARAADHVVAEITAAGGRAIASYDTVATDEGCRAIATAAVSAFGRIDAVVHNAGILRNAPFADMTDERFLPVLTTHLLGGFYLSRAVWPHLAAQRYGRLVFTSSGSGLFGRVDGANYASAKAGIIGLCNALALEGVEHGILANAILPVATSRLAGGPDAADLSPEADARRAASLAASPRMDPGWVSPLVAYLASDSCTRTHRYYSAALGRYAQAFVGVTDGWTARGDRPPTPDEIAQHLAEIEDRSTFHEPQSVFEELDLIRQARP